MLKPLKILFITHKFYPDLGGTEANAEFLAGAFHDKGAIVHLLTWTKTSGTKEFPYRIVRNPGLLQVISEHAWADVVFENSPVLRLSWPAAFFNKRLVVVLNTWLNNEDGSKSLQARLKYAWLKKATKVITVSDALRKKCWPEATVIENAYNDKLFVRINAEAQRTKRFVFLGRVVSDKGADMAIEAINKLKNEHVNQALGDISLTVIGEGKDLAKLKQYVKDLNLEDLVTFEGSLTGERLVASLNQHNYLLVPSRWEEPFGIVALEGLACGCIPVVSDGGGLPDAVGDAGIVFKRGDIEDMVNSITNVLTDTSLQQRLKAAANKHLQEHSSEVVAQQYFDIIQASVS
ncbi:MAG TPA: glycosyltransferase family 4 protein [Mucilaginibacter sp.]